MITVLMMLLFLFALACVFITVTQSAWGLVRDTARGIWRLIR